MHTAMSSLSAVVRRGIAAAKAAAADGRRVILVEQEVEFGGDVTQLQKLPERPGAHAHRGRAYYDHDFVTLAETTAGGAGMDKPRERLWLVRATRVVLATGAIEQPLIFSNNDRPGVHVSRCSPQILAEGMA